MDKVQNAQRQRKKMVILLVIFILTAGAAVAIGAVILNVSKPQASDSSGETGGMAYEANIITDNEDSLQDAVDQLIEKAKEGQMSLEMQTVASSGDGRNFTCYLANSAKNNYDMFMVLYLDDTQQEIHRTGLIPIGARIEDFTLEEALAPGTYEATIVYNQVEEDRETIHAQVYVGLTLIVR